MAELQAVEAKPKHSKGYEAVRSTDDDDDDARNATSPYNDDEPSPSSLSKPLPPPPAAYAPRRVSSQLYQSTIITLTTVLLLTLGFGLFYLRTTYRRGLAAGGASCPCAPNQGADVPQHFQTSPELWPGPTATGKPAFMAQTRTFVPTATYVPNSPLQTSIPIEGMGAMDESIFKMMGYLTPYAPSPGFGVDEYPLPPGAEIVQVQMLSRHGSRYPTTGSNVQAFGDRLLAAKSRDKRRFHPHGALAFLEDWSYDLGYEILVPRGRQELFDSGILHSYMYGSLYDTSTKIIARTTTQDRMLKSAEYFMAGFFGLEWTEDAMLEVIIEKGGFNNSLAGYMQCPNARLDHGGTSDAKEWIGTYLQNATTRLGKLTGGYVWTIEDSYAAQTMCPYETVAYGYSRFCDLFTYDEWVGFSYSIDLAFSGNSGSQSKSGRAVGLGYQQELVARLRNHTLAYSHSNINTTLDSDTATFPLNQTLYFDFSHDTNIVSILTAIGLTQFSTENNHMPTTHYPGPHNFTVSHITPFGARLDVELIKARAPVPADRSASAGEGEAKETMYVHFVLNQRTVPLGVSFPECDVSRVDGWCELETFLKVQDGMAALANFDEVCFGEVKGEKPESATLERRSGMGDDEIWPWLW